jgi:molybdate transport system substrate-binding protein
MYGQVQPKLVFGENVTQALQFAESGAADVGIVALSIVSAPHIRDKGRFWEVPQEAYSPLDQGGLILKRARDPEAAKTFRDFLLGDSGRAVLKRYGFLLPESQ